MECRPSSKAMRTCRSMERRLLLDGLGTLVAEAVKKLQRPKQACAETNVSTSCLRIPLSTGQECCPLIWRRGKVKHIHPLNRFPENQKDPPPHQEKQHLGCGYCAKGQSIPHSILASKTQTCPPAFAGGIVFCQLIANRCTAQPCNGSLGKASLLCRNS